MVLLTTVLVPIVLVASWHEADDEGNGGSRAFVAWVLALEAMSLAVFTATDVFLFYVVFEATLIPAYFLIGGFGRAGRGRAATKFLIYQLAGGLIMLASVIGLYVVSADSGRPSLPDHRPRRARHRPDHAALAVRRLLHRLRDQGADVPGAHVAGRHDREARRPAPRCCWSACSTRSAPSACCASASGCCPTRRSGPPRSWSCWRSSRSCTARWWPSGRTTSCA